MREIFSSARGGAAGVLLVLLVLGLLGTVLFFARNAPLPTSLKGFVNPPEGSQSAEVYFCPMHPQVQSDQPGTCPICNMDLEKMEPGLDASTAEADEELSVERVRISPRKQQLIGVRVSQVTEGPVSSTIRAVGRLTYDETRISRIQTKIEGWIEQVFVNYTGSPVKKGQPLASIYSPELFSAQRELLIAVKSREALAGSPFPGVASDARSLHEAAKQRLKLWDIPDGHIREIERRGHPIRAMPVFSPMDGFVVSRNAFPGQRITPATELYSVADLSTIWVLAEVYEYEIPLVQPGQNASMSLSHHAGRRYVGKVAYVYPDLDKVTRTLRIRLEFPNPDLQLKPEMYANVEIPVSHGMHLSLPSEAVMNSGMEQVVFVALDDGYFEPRRVQAGATVGDRTIIVDGLKAGENVVTAGNFLIDSESRLKAALRSIGGGSHSGHTPKEQRKDRGSSADGVSERGTPIRTDSDHEHP